MIPATATFWKEFDVKWGTNCVHCGRRLTEGEKAWGTKIGEKKWAFVCPSCYDSEILGKKAVEPEPGDTDLFEAFAEAAKDESKSAGNKAPVPEREPSYLERIQYTAKWRFKKGVLGG